MNPWVIGIVGLLIGLLPSVFYYKKLSPLQNKLQSAEKGKKRSEKAYNEAQAELKAKNIELIIANNKIVELEEQLNRFNKQSHSLITDQKRLDISIDDRKREDIELETEIVEIEQNLERLYSHLLEGIKKTSYFYNQQTHPNFSSYLQSLKNHAKQLWQSYRSDQVVVNYSDPSIQAAYLIRYYPNYAGLTFRVLETLQKQNPNILGEKVTNKIQACFFGAGPCPEVVGLSNFLFNNYKQVEILIANVFDIDADGWTPSRNLTKDFIIPHYLQGQLKLNSYQLDLCEANSLHCISEMIRHSNLFIFQNCLNELYYRGAVQSNIDFLLQEISTNSLIIIIDFCNYQQNRLIIDQLKEKANQRNFKVSFHQKTWNFYDFIPISQDVQQYLLTGEEQLIRQTNISSVFMSMQKNSSHNNMQNLTEVSNSRKPQRKIKNRPQRIKQKAYSIEEIQKTYARAYTPWTKEDDERLKYRYNQGATINDLVQEFQRQPGGIRSRLKKLGLLS